MKTLKIQNIVMPKDMDDNLMCYVQLAVRGKNNDNPFSYDPESGAYFLRQYETADFMCYYNCLQLQRWKEYTDVKTFQLCLQVSGKFVVELYEITRNSDNIDFKCIATQTHNEKDGLTISLDIPDSSSELIGFKLTALENGAVYGGYYAASVDEMSIRDVNIALVTTTFKKQNYIKHNMQMLHDKVLDQQSDLKGHIFVNVIDNERTLLADEYCSDDLKIYPNKNVGGAGGFTRGMIEAMSNAHKPTHILLMDDDVMIIPESLFRTYYLLRLLKKEYQQCFLSGAMFDYDARERQYEDVGYIHKMNAEYGPIKPAYDMREVPCLINNEKYKTYDIENAYAGWWFCCIPVEHIENRGLPLPVFVRGDDVEFSLRNQPGFITLNGICIWHVGFAGKFNAAMELYQVHRNSLIIQAVSGAFPEIDFYKRITEMFWREITRFAYGNAELLLDSIDDFLKGPQYLMHLDGELSLKEHNAKNEKLIPLPQISYPVRMEEVYAYRPVRKFAKLIYMVTLNGHLLPDLVLKKQPNTVAYDWFFSAGSYYRRRKLVAVNPKNQTGCVRVMDRKRCFALLKRYRKVTHAYRKEHLNIAKQYRAMQTEMASLAFWKEYLEI